MKISARSKSEALAELERLGLIEVVRKPRFSCRKQRLDDARIGIESLVCQQGVGQHLGQKRVGTFQIMSLPRSQEESQRIAKGIDHGMDFRAQSAFAAPDRLVFAVFF